jgi:antibiotic biosynthesis monooxygenase (ABM) superfamily enzyme
MSDITNITHFVKKGKNDAFEAWLHGIVQEAARFAGYQGINIIKPTDDRNEYTTTIRFDEVKNRNAWEASAVRAEWVKKLKPIIEKEAIVKHEQGIEFWFAASVSNAATPPKWKMAVLAFCCSFPLIFILTNGFKLFTPQLALPLRLCITSLCMIVSMTWWLMPLLTKMFKSWLYPLTK